MALKAQVASLEGLSDATKALYQPVKDDAGKVVAYRLDVEPVDGLSLENVTGLKGALAKERARADELAKAVTDPAAKAAQEAALQQAQQAAQQLPAVQAELERLKTVAAAAEAKLQTMTGKAADAELKAAAERAGAIDGDLLMPHLKPRVKVEQDGTGLRIVPVDATGQPRQRLDPKTDKLAPMELDDLLQELRQDKKFMPLFKGNQATGSTGAGQNKPAHKPGAYHPQHSGDVNRRLEEALSRSMA